MKKTLAVCVLLLLLLSLLVGCGGNDKPKTIAENAEAEAKQNAEAEVERLKNEIATLEQEAEAKKKANEKNKETSSATDQKTDNLTTCPDCGKEVSKRAAACPHCGAPLTEQASPPEPAKVVASNEPEDPAHPIARPTKPRVRFGPVPFDETTSTTAVPSTRPTTRPTTKSSTKPRVRFGPVPSDETIKFGRPTPRPYGTLPESPALNKLRELSKFGTDSETAYARSILYGVRKAVGIEGIQGVTPSDQRDVVKYLPILLPEEEADTIIKNGIRQARRARGDIGGWSPNPEAPGKESAFWELQKLSSFGTVEERIQASRLWGAIAGVGSKGLRSVSPDLQRSVIPWLEPWYGKKKADRILGR